MICPDCHQLRHPGTECRWRECEACKGTGVVTEEYQVGGYSPDRWVEVRERQVQCDACDGLGDVSVDPWDDD